MSPPTAISFFDLDKTLLSINSSFYFCYYLFRKGVFSSSYLATSFLYYLRHKFFHLSVEDLHKAIFDKLLRGFSLETLENEMESFIEDKLKAMVYLPVFSQLKLAQQLGHYTVILSNSPTFIVSAMARFFSVDEWRGTEYAIDKDQKLCHIATLMLGEEKAKCMMQIAKKFNIANDSITAYSDSFEDLPFLLAAGKPIAVNPDKRLRQFAKKQNWEIL